MIRVLEHFFGYLWKYPLDTLILVVLYTAPKGNFAGSTNTKSLYLVLCSRDTEVGK